MSDAARRRAVRSNRELLLSAKASRQAAMCAAARTSENRCQAPPTRSGARGSLTPPKRFHRSPRASKTSLPVFH